MSLRSTISSGQKGFPPRVTCTAASRSDYNNQDGPLSLHPTFSYAPEEDTCLPLVIAGPAVDRVKAHLARQARASSVLALGAKLAKSLSRGTRTR